MIHDFIACSPLTLSNNQIASLTLRFVPKRPQAPPQPSTYVCTPLCQVVACYIESRTQFDIQVTTPMPTWGLHNVGPNMGLSQVSPLFVSPKKRCHPPPPFESTFHPPCLDMLKEVVKAGYYWVLFLKIGVSQILVLGISIIETRIKLIQV